MRAMNSLPKKPMKKSLGKNKTRSVQILVAAFALNVCGPGAIRAQDYLGASNVLAPIEAHQAKPAEKDKNDETARLRQDLKSFRLSQTNLAPADAAQQWLALVERVTKVKKQSVRNYDESN